MAHALDHVEYLSKDIGARPAGTEEEQEAAFYIADQFKKEAGFPAEIEEFTSTSNIEGINAIWCVVTIVMTLLAIFVPMLVVPAFILSAIAAALFTLESLDKPFVSRLLARGASQNVVAKYQPYNPSDADQPRGRVRGRSRKVVLVARYGSGKVVSPVVQRVESLGVPMGLFSVIGMIAAAVLLLIRIPAGNGAGFGSILLNILTILALLLCLWPVIKAVLDRTAAYNEGANNNATGVAALIEVARRISQGRMSEEELARMEAEKGVAIHGEQAALESGLIPEGAQIVYEAERLTPPDIEPLDDEERLLAAKAAIAALTGQPVEKKIYGSAASELVNSRVSAEVPQESPAAVQEAQADWTGAQPRESVMRLHEDAVEAQPETAMPAPVVEAAPVEAQPQVPVDTFENAPDWFVAAQQKAKRPTGETGPIQRSRYSEAIEAAEREAAERELARQEEERLARERELREREEAALAAIAAEAAERAAAKQAELAPEEPVSFQAGEQLEVKPYAPTAPAQQPAVEETAYAPEGPATQPYPEEQPLPAFKPMTAEDAFAAVAHEAPVEAPAAVAVEEPVIEQPPAMPTAQPVEAPVAAVEQIEYEEAPAQPEQPEQPEVDVQATQAFPPIPTSSIAAEIKASFEEESPEQSAAAPAPEQAAQPEAPAFDVPPIEPVEEEPEEESEEERYVQRRTRRNLASLPSIDPNPKPAENTSPSRSGLFRKLRTDVPSLSGVIRLQEAGEDVSQKPNPAPAPLQVPDPMARTVQPAQSKAAAPKQQPAATQKPAAAPQPQAAETVDYDMEYEGSSKLVEGEDATPTSADARSSKPAPRPRAAKASAPSKSHGGFLDRFRSRKREELSETPQEWLNVDEDFEARAVGKERGSWKSFRDEQVGSLDEFDDEFGSGDGETSRNWQGGAFSKLRSMTIDRFAKNGEEDADAPEEELEDAAAQAGAEEQADRAEEAAPESERRERPARTRRYEADDEALAQEIEQIYNFRNPDYGSEIWFVAIGSDTEFHDGAKAFISEHMDELRGAMVVEVESLGAGALSTATEEGSVRRILASSRVKRFTRSAQAATGIKLENVKLTGNDSVASIAQRAGFQSTHILGSEGNWPALKGSADDVLENIDEDLLEENIDFIMELLKRN